MTEDSVGRARADDPHETGDGGGRGGDDLQVTEDGGGREGGADGEVHQESQKSYQTILEQEIAAGKHELERSAKGLTLSGLSAGLDLGFSVLLMGVMYTLARDAFPEAVVEMLVANMYAIGFIFVIFGRSELFTEHTTLAFLPVIDGQASIAQLGRLWGIVYAANLVGICAFAAFAAWLAPELGVVERSAFTELAHRVTDHPWWVITLSAVLAGWMMGLLSWLVTAGRDTISQIFFVWLVTAAIGFTHLHHSILGTGEVLAGVLQPGSPVGWGALASFTALATVGNAVGGIVFVGLIKYAHASSKRFTSHSAWQD